jgi:hypothetical protein
MEKSVFSRVYLSLLVLCIFVDAGVFLYYRQLGEQEFKTEKGNHVAGERISDVRGNPSPALPAGWKTTSRHTETGAERENLKWGTRITSGSPAL